MAKPAEKLAESLEALKKFQDGRGIAVIRSKDLTRTHRDRLVAGGFLHEIIKGWYIAARPGESPGDSTSWFTSFWRFTAAYCRERFGRDWCLSPEQSLAIHTGNYSVPTQLLVRSPKASNNKIDLPHGVSLFDMAASLPPRENIFETDGINLLTVPAALRACSPGYFSRYPTDARAALMMIEDASEILGHLLEGGHSTVAGRLAGAFRNTGRARIADEIVSTMKTAGYAVREIDPFKDTLPLLAVGHVTSPHMNRILLMWHAMRRKVIDVFPKAPGMPGDSRDYLHRIDENYQSDAYHSLSIEGYRVTSELIEKVKGGEWNPDGNDEDRGIRDALAARGYWQAFQAVKSGIAEILKGANPGQVAEDGHRLWYREMFAPSVTAGIIKASDLAGYRSDQVYIRGSMHIPPRPDAVGPTMASLFQLLREEREACVRAVLGHFMFVYIHPYMDGNGRIGRFLMNAMLASGGYPWTIIPTGTRNEYMAALEKASVRQDIVPFSRFIARLVKGKNK
jgi:fido (protein-threonine AMPylation protein)